MNKSAQFTPGPWTVQDSTDNDDDTTLTIYASKDEASIAIMDAFENGCECFSEIRANAALIAAAPAMYEALHSALNNVDRLGDVRSAYRATWIKQVTKLLAQAEGRHHE